MKIALLKKADIIGVLLSRILRVPRALSHGSGTFLIIRPGGIGDAVLLVPAIRALHEKFPGASVDILAERRNFRVFDLCPEIRNVFLYDKPLDLFRVLRCRYDVVIDTEQWHRLSAIVARVVRSGEKIGFDTNERRRMFTHAVKYSQDEYETVNFLCLFRHLADTLSFAFGEPYLVLTNEKLLGVASSLLRNKSYVVLFPGASVPERRWGAERFREMAEWLNNCGLLPVVVGGKGDHGIGDQIVSRCGVNLAGTTSLTATAAIVAGAILIISGDSGILHIAVGLGVPTVSLFGPGRAKKWAPRGDNHIVINKDLPCSPCTTFGYTPRCPINARCMTEISVDEVEEAVLTLLSRKNFDGNQQKP